MITLNGISLQTIMRLRADGTVDLENMGKSADGSSIFHTLNSDPPASALVWTIQSDAERDLYLWALYATADQRLVSIAVNDSSVTFQGMADVTGGWTSAFAQWRYQAPVRLKVGENIIRLWRNGPMPSILDMALTAEVPAGTLTPDERHESIELIRDILHGTPVGVIQIGANTGGEVRAFAAAGIDQALFVEPVPVCFGYLEQTIKLYGRPKYMAVQSLISNCSEDRDFYVASNLGVSSSLLQPTGHLTDFPDVGFDSTIKIRTETLDSLIARTFGIPSPFDFLFMDTQGAELLILQGASMTLRDIRYIWTEVSVKEFYQGGVLLPELVSWLSTEGFQLHYAHITLAGSGDALFARTT